MSENGLVNMTLYLNQGKIIQRFEHSMEEVIYDPQNAIDVAMMLSDLAFEAQEGMKPASDTLKAELIERHRMTCTQRAANILNTDRGNIKVSNGQLGQDLVEMVLREVF
jgi:hypothetical protein